MDEVRQILIAHAKKYPMMEATDAVKLIYQNEFGGGHLIRDEQACMNYLFREYENITKNKHAPLYESIGNGLIRVNLCTVKKEKLESLGFAFIRSAAHHRGTLARFCAKLEILKELTAEGYFFFGMDELQQYLETLKAAGYPAVSHSPSYRQLYQPSYRVIQYSELESI